MAWLLLPGLRERRKSDSNRPITVLPVIAMAQQGTPESSGSAAQPGEKAPFLPRTALPKGGGAIRGIGEKVAVNPARGSGTLQVPVFTSPGPRGFGPALGLPNPAAAGAGEARNLQGAAAAGRVDCDLLPDAADCPATLGQRGSGQERRLLAGLGGRSG